MCILSKDCEFRLGLGKWNRGGRVYSDEEEGTRERKFLIEELDFSIIPTVYSGEQSNYASNNEKL